MKKIFKILMIFTVLTANAQTECDNNILTNPSAPSGDPDARPHGNSTDPNLVNRT